MTVIGSRIIHVDAAEEEIALEFKELLVTAFDELTLKTYIGEV